MSKDEAFSIAGEQQISLSGKISVDPTRIDWCIARALYIASHEVLLKYPLMHHLDAIIMIDILKERYPLFKEALECGFRVEYGGHIDSDNMRQWIFERKQQAAARYGFENSDLPF